MNLRSGVLAVHECKSEQPFSAELAQGPNIWTDALLSTAGVGHRGITTFASGCIERDALKRAGGQAELLVISSHLRREPGVRLVQPQEIFALNVEDERFCVRGIEAERVRVKEGIQNEAC